LPSCQSPQIRNLNRTTDLGYAVFRCGDCRRKSNERTGTPFNYLEFPTDIVFEIVLCRLRYKLSLRNLAEMFLGKPGRRWYVDETYLKIKGKWSYLYRAIDREGNLVDAMLSATRDMTAAQRFFRSTLAVIHQPPKQVTTDGHDAYPRAIREVLGPQVQHRCSAFLNRRIERDHRGINSDTIRRWALASFGQPSASVGHSRKLGSTFDPAAYKTKSSHSPRADDSFCSERWNWNRCSSPRNQSDFAHTGPIKPTDHHVPRILTLSLLVAACLQQTKNCEANELSY
jgi:transposase-like protein